MFVKLMGIVALMCSSVFCFHYDKDCIAREGWDTDGIRSSWDIRFWVSKRDTANVLSIVSENPPKSSLRKIDITRKQVDYFFGRSGVIVQNSTSIAGEGLSPGWKEVRVTSDERFRVWVEGMDEPIVDVEDEVQAESIIVMGSNVTINCGGQMTVWIGAEDNEIFVPVDVAGRYDITMFSRTPFSPVMKLGHHIQLFSWDSQASTVTTFATRPNPLPPFKEHNFTFQCDSVGFHFNCKAVAGQNTLVASVYLIEEIESLSFHGPGLVEFVIALRHTNEDKMSDDSEISNTLEERVMAGNDGNLPEKSYLLYTPLFINILINIVLLGITLALCFKNKKRKEIIRSNDTLSLRDAKESSVRKKLYSIFCKPILQSWKGERDAKKTDNSNEENLLNKDTNNETAPDPQADKAGNQK